MSASGTNHVEISWASEVGKVLIKSPDAVKQRISLHISLENRNCCLGLTFPVIHMSCNTLAVI